MRGLALLLLAGVAIAQAPSDKPQPSPNLKQVMRGVLLPNANIIFSIQLKALNDGVDWQTVENAAVGIQQAANLILMAGRLRSNGQPVPVQAADYVKFANALVPAGRDCLKAAQKKSRDIVNDCTDSLSQACDNCHNVYRDPVRR
jgi:hypothetical protein